MIAVVVTYHPNEDVVDNVAAMVRECGAAIVVDNGSAPAVVERLRKIAGVEVIALPKNRGIAHALNTGIARAETRDVAAVVTFDQDSCPEPAYGEAMRRAAEKWPDAAVIGSHIVETALRQDYCWLRPSPRWPGLFQRVPMAEGGLRPVTMVITSGAFTRLSCWRKLGGFDEDLFIDFVDTDFCLRVRAAGGQVAVSGEAKLHHHLGQRERRSLAGVVMHPTHHNAVRHYFVARNRVRMLARHGWRTAHWLGFELVFTGVWIVRTLAFETNRSQKLLGMLLGTWDGVLGRKGACPPGRLKPLT